VINIGSGPGFAMVFALLLSAIIWNLGTWYLGLPASSSHTLVGSIMGVGLANSMLSAGHVFGEGVNWAKAQETGMSLLISPIIGFCCAGLLLLLSKALIRTPSLYQAPEGEKAPPLPIRALLVLTCTGVSFAHGSNDGQKGMGLIMLILIGIVPGGYALNLHESREAVRQLQTQAALAESVARKPSPGIHLSASEATDELSRFLKTTGTFGPNVFPALAEKAEEISVAISDKDSLEQLSKEQRSMTRTDIYLTSESIGKLVKQNRITDPADKQTLTSYKNQLEKITKFIPDWVKVAVAIALGLGTMIGWKRIVVTVGEKIGKTHLSYAQGAAAELVAMGTIFAADQMGLPVSTTHVLSSGVAGTMAANKSGLQGDTLRNLLLAWVLTLPVCVFLGATLFSAGLYITLHVFGVH
jgi:PiT family inorganic phosphate transporter